MDKRWRNMLIIVAAIAAVAAALILVLQPQKPLDFETGLSELNGAWSKKSASIYMDDTRVAALSPEAISALKLETMAFRERAAKDSGAETGALDAAANAYLARLDFFAALKESDAANGAVFFSGVESDSEACSKIAALEAIQEKLKSLSQKMAVFEGRAGQFLQKFPAFAEKSGFRKNPEKLSELEEAVQQNTRLIAEMRVDCA